MNILNQQKLQEVINKYQHSIDDQPAIFVGDYASYNEGHIVGAWFDLTQFSDFDELTETIEEFMQELDKVAPLDFHALREEYMYQDFQTIPKSLINESWLSPDIVDYARAWEEDNDIEDLFNAYKSCGGESNDIETIKNNLEVNLNDIQGSNEDEKYGYWLEECGCIEIPEHIKSYFDYKAYGRDALINAYSYNGYVFSSTD